MEHKRSTQILWMSAVSVVEALHLLIAAAIVLSFIPIPMNAYEHSLLPVAQSGLKPERETQLFRFFIVAAIAVQAVLLHMFRRGRQGLALRRMFIRLLIVDGALLLLQAFAAFKIFIYGDSWWAKGLMYGAAVIWVLTKIFWTECNRFGRAFLNSPKTGEFMRLSAPWGGAAGGIFIVLFLYIPDFNHALALVQQFANPAALDQWVGTRLMPYVSLTHTQALGFILAMIMAYWLGLYAFLHHYLKCWTLSLISVLAAMKFNLFHAGMFPIFFASPMDTVLGTWPDIFLVMAMASLGRSQGTRPLWVAAAAVGLMLAWEPGKGVWVLLALWIYMAIVLSFPRVRTMLFCFPRDRAALKGCLYVPFLIAGGCLLLFDGNSVFSGAWLHKTMEQVRLWFMGNNAHPIFEALKTRQFFAFDLGFVLPVVYLINAWWAVKRRAPFVLFVALYAVCLHMDFIVYSTTSRYYAAAVLLVILGAVHVRRLIQAWPIPRRWAAGAAGLFIAAGALLTNGNALNYPNALNVGRIDWQQIARPWQAAAQFRSDADMIKAMTPEKSRVPVMSPFEVPLLIMADRKPYFEHVPMMVAAPNMPPQADTTMVYTVRRLERAREILSAKRPPYIFVDSTLYNSAQSQWMNDLRAHYTPIRKGNLIWALQRRE